MFRRRRRNFSRFRSRFKMRRRSAYPHQGGRWQRCQFTLPNIVTGSGGASDVNWNDMLGITGHLQDPTTPDGVVLTQIARYIEVRAIQWDATFAYYVPPASVSAETSMDWLFAGWCVDRDDAAGNPASASFYDPFTTESPVEEYPPAPTTTQLNLQSPLRWLRVKYVHCNAGNLNNVQSIFSNGSYYARWSARYSRTFRLDDTTGLYWVTGRNTLLDGELGSSAQVIISGALWYRVAFGR